MSRREIVLGIAGAILLLLGARWIRSAELPKQYDVLEGGGCRTPFTILNPPADVNPAGSAILIHGLAANRRLMTYLGADFAGHGFRSYLLDLPGHGDNTDAFTFAAAQQCANVAVASLIHSGRIDPRTTVVVGHSMGGAIAIRMADVEPVAATIAISPAPLVMPRRMPSNLLVFSAEFDIRVLKKQAKSLAEAAGGTRLRPEDFSQQRAFDLQQIPFATHTTIILDRTVAHRAELWAMRALFPSVPIATLTLNLDLATYETSQLGRKRLAGSIIGLLGIFLMFPLSATLLLPSRSRQTTAPKKYPDRILVVLETAVSAFAAVWVIAIVNPLGFLRIYTGDYLASLLLIVGLLLLLLNRNSAKAHFPVNIRALIAAAALGLATILAIGGWANWQLDDAWMDAPRWLRFAGLLPVTWLFCFAEEVVLGPAENGKRQRVRFLLFLALRLVIWLVCVLAYYKLANGQALIAILLPGLAMFSILQRLGADAVAHRTGSSIEAATFSAILAAWFLAAVFPLT